MSGTRTRYVSFQTLVARRAGAVTVVKLMMACNDLSLANQSLFDWKQEQPNDRKARQRGAGMYFVRLQLSHLSEGLKVIEEIRKDAALRALVDGCDEQTRQSFGELETFLPGGRNDREFARLVIQVRSNLVFHYDESGKMISRTIADRADRAGGQISSVTRGSTAYLWHFQVADDVMDSVVVRHIWRIPRDTDVRSEADKVADRVHQIFLWFVDFAGEFIWKYCET